jgi:hypothetical protein
LILAEGITEEILLTAFSNAAGLDFDKNGIKIVSSGGKNKILKQYDRLRREAGFPILMIFDSDGHELAEATKKSLRSIDDVYVIPQGEFEDILPEELICKAINSHYRLFGEINVADIEGTGLKSHILERLWQKKGFGKFRKAEFASIVAGHISNATSLSTELKVLFSKINNMLSATSQESIK